MKGQILCIPCTVRATYDIATKATDNEELQMKAVTEVLKWLSENHNLLDMTPAMIHTYAFRLVQKITGNNDPFAQLKRESNRIAMKLSPLLRDELARLSFREAFKFAALGAICGNSIDFEVEGYEVTMGDLEKSLMKCLRGKLTIDDTPKLMDALSKANRVLYLLDNAGEIAFDKIFIEFITSNYPVKVLAVVKSAPILNDATMEDALQVELNSVAEVITTGSSSIGLNLDECSEEFLRQLERVDLIIAKGQGYYESVTEIENILRKPIVYMLRAKCLAVAKSLNVHPGANIIKLVNY
ncbi:DUF89 family protein [Candidatus Bathyarchaeota archaeon]|nr:DUF89 family protein [Candidatus Bathyarchaeota archaeon]